jgi:hypothetical protein
MNREAEARALLGELLDKPEPRALKIAGIYAALYLEDPLVFIWHGLACFVARQVNLALAAPSLGFDGFMGDGNLKIYTSMVGATLSFRRGEKVEGPLEGAFKKLKKARELVERDLMGAEALVEEAIGEQSVVEQRDILQPDYAQLPDIKEKILKQVFCFRLGYDSAAPVLLFNGKSPANLKQRLDWTSSVILPAWKKWRKESAEWVRADVNRVRREAGVKVGWDR